MGKQRFRVEALPDAAASPAPPLAGDLIPDPTLADDLLPDDLTKLLADAQRWARTITPAQILGQIGSPFAPDQQPPVGEDHAA